MASAYNTLPLYIERYVGLSQSFNAMHYWLFLTSDYDRKGLTSTQLVVAQLYLNYWRKELGNLTYNPLLLVSAQMMPQKQHKVAFLIEVYPVLNVIVLSFTIYSTVLIVEEKASNVKVNYPFRQGKALVYRPYSDLPINNTFLNISN